MVGFLRRTLLYQRVSEAWSAYSALRQAQHRAALKAKRAAVRSRVISEVQNVQIEQAVLKMEKIKSELRVQGVQAVADKFKERDELIREAVSAHGITLQSDPMTQPPPQLSSDNQVPADKADAVKERIIAKVESMLPAVEESGPGRRIAADVLRESVESASLGNINEEGQMGARLLAEVAKQAGVNWEEMERLIEFTEKDAEKRQELRALVKEAMNDVKQRPQESIAQPGT